MKILLWLSILGLFACSKLNYTPAKSPKAFTDPRDGQKYGYVEINNKYWMTENMRYKVEGSKLNPDNPSPLFGRLYNWEQAMKACPEGWWLSTNSDWFVLESTFIPNTDTLVTRKKTRGNNVGILKSKKYWDPAGTDSLKMNILPAGDFGFGKFDNLGTGTGFWTSTPDMRGGELAKEFAYYRIFTNKSKGIFYNIQDKNLYYSCRCVKHIENNPYLDA